MITLYKRGKVYWAQATFRGIQRKWSLQTRDRGVAQELVRQTELEKLSSPGHRRKSWADFQREFLAWIEPQVSPRTCKEYTRVLNIFAAFLGHLNVSELAGAAEAGIQTRYAETRLLSVHRINGRRMSRGGLKYELRVLRRAFSYAVEEGWLVRNPVRAGNLNAAAGRTLPFSADDVHKMTAAAYLESRAYLRAIVLLFLHTGLRISDVIYLHRESLQESVLHLKTKKRGKVVRLLLHPDVVAALKTHNRQQTAVQKKSPYAFSTETGQPILSLDKHLRRLWKACGVEKGHAHRFRDTLAVRLLENGASLYDVAKILGISHQVVELHYAPYVQELQERSARLLKNVDYHRSTAAVQ